MPDSSLTHHITPAIVAEIEDDAPLVEAFLQWQVRTHTYPVRGFSGSGGGNLRTVFDADDRDAVQLFFAAQYAERRKR